MTLQKLVNQTKFKAANPKHFLVEQQENLKQWAADISFLRNFETQQINTKTVFMSLLFGTILIQLTYLRELVA
jgi:hypothetical protein